MELRGTIKRSGSTFPERKILIELETDGRLEDIEKLRGKDLDITFKVHREKRSLDANAFLWSCLGKMGGVISDMEQMGLERPTDEHLKAIIEEVEKRYEKAEIHDRRTA